MFTKINNKNNLMTIHHKINPNVNDIFAPLKRTKLFYEYEHGIYYKKSTSTSAIKKYFNCLRFNPSSLVIFSILEEKNQRLNYCLICCEKKLLLDPNFNVEYLRYYSPSELGGLVLVFKMNIDINNCIIEITDQGVGYEYQNQGLCKKSMIYCLNEFSTVLSEIYPLKEFSITSIVTSMYLLKLYPQRVIKEHIDDIDETDPIIEITIPVVEFLSKHRLVLERPFIKNRN